MTKQATNKTTSHTGAKRALRAALVASVLGFTATIQTQAADADATEYGRRIAFCIGINDYSQHTKLSCAVRDAVSMARLFDSYGYDEVVLLTDAKATKKAITAYLNKFQAEGSDNDLLVFFYAGHGTTIRNGKDLEGYLVPSNSRRGHEVEDGISMAALSQMAKAMPHRHTLFLMDACYSGFGLPSGELSKGYRVTSRTLKNAMGNRTVQILAAGGQMDRAFESKGHGLFTRNVLRCLRGLSPEGKDGLVSGRELARSVQSRVKSETGGWQNPHFGSYGDGDVVFRVGKDAKVAGSLAAARRTATSSTI